jgi:hypothetical protein
MFKNRKIVRTKFRILFVLGYIILITLFDSYSYGIIYQQKIKQENYTNPVWSWVFKESGQEANGEHVTVPYYRIIEKSIEIIGALIIFYYCGFWCFLGILISHYLLTYDLLFYLILNQTYLFHEFQYQNSPYWLQNWYQVGYFVLQPFNPMMFYIVGFLGVVIAMGMCNKVHSQSLQSDFKNKT